MAQLVVRNVDPELVRLLRERARARGHSVEAEHRLLLEQVLRRHSENFWESAAALRREVAARENTNSTELIRADRDRDSD